MDERFQRLREARIAKGFETAAAAADAFGWNRNTYGSNENGNAPFSYRRAKENAAALCVGPGGAFAAARAPPPAAAAGVAARHPPRGGQTPRPRPLRPGPGT